MKSFYRIVGYAFMALVLMGSLLFDAPVQAATRREAGLSTSASLVWMKEEELRKRLQDIKDLGVTWLRVDFSWPLIQPNGPDAFDWEKYDQLVRVVNEFDLKILALLVYTPEWAQDPVCSKLVGAKEKAERCAPRDVEQFAHFAASISYRYKGDTIRAWEIWNEPNLTAYWKVPHGEDLFASPNTYAKLANATATRLRAHEPTAVIITGGLAPLFEPSYPKGTRQSDFIAQLLPQLKKELFDAVGIHPYSWPILPEKPEVYNAFFTVDNGKKELNIRQIMNEAGWGDKEIWGTEYGATTRGKKWVAKPTKGNRPDHVTEDMQAKIVAQGVEHWYKKQNIGPLFVHSDSDQWLAKHKNEGGFGMRRTDGSKKPAYDAFRSAVDDLSQ